MRSACNLVVSAWRPIKATWSTLKVPTLPGQYRLCATIDPDDVYPETENTSDNVIFSENIVLVQ